MIEPIFEHGFSDVSFGFRPGRGCRDALREVDGLIKDGYTFVVDADLQAYFDSIPHDRLVAGVMEKVADGGILASHPRLAEGRYPEGDGTMDAGAGLSASWR